MSFARTIRAWIVSVVAANVMLMVWVAAIQAISGRPAHMLHNAIDLSIAFGAVFAVTAAVVHVPVFAVTDALLGQRFSRRYAMCVGAILAPATCAGIAWRFRETDGPRTAVDWLLYWAEHLPQFALWTLPFIIAGALFGFLWTGQDGRRAREVEHTV